MEDLQSLKACEGSDFGERKDAAIIRTFIETGPRLSELVNLNLTSMEVEGALDPDEQVVVAT